ncbi:MAG: hypothetical protein K6348_07805 [Deferribacterales bacterium]
MAFIGDFDKVLELFKYIYDHNRGLYEFILKRGVDLLKVKSYDDFRKIKILKKSELSLLHNQNPPFGGLIQVKPLKLYQSPGPINNVKLEDYHHYRFYKALKMCGFNSDDLVVNSFGYTITPAGEMFDEGCRYLNIPVFPLGPVTSEKSAEIVDTFSATGFIGTKTFLMKTLEHCKKGSLKKAYLIAEKMTEDDRRFFKDRYGIDAYQGYGTAEVGLIATEGIGFNFMQIDKEKIFIEHLDPNTEESTPLFDYGEAVVTFLDYRLPFIRLATGDLVAYEGEHLKGVFGRTDSSVKVKGVFIHYWEFESFCNEIGIKGELLVEHSLKNDIINLRVSGVTPDLKEKFKKRFGLNINEIFEGNVESNKIIDGRKWR